MCLLQWQLGPYSIFYIVFLAEGYKKKHDLYMITVGESLEQINAQQTYKEESSEMAACMRMTTPQTMSY